MNNRPAGGSGSRFRPVRTGSGGQGTLAQNEYVLEMKGITKEFPGVKALDGVTFQLRPGSVHALMGENGAGKSTLMKCLYGIYAPDAGDIVLNGQKVLIHHSKDALGYGISMIHQELHPVPFRNVMENIWLGRFPTKGFIPFRFIDHKKMHRETKALLKQLDIDVEPDTIVGKLSVSKIQSIEIAKAVSYGSRIIIMDEPTSSLTKVEAEQLFRMIRDLKKRGVAIIYISHKMEEILKICDEVTIMRDGQTIGTWPASGLTTDLMISKMVGRDLTQRFPDREHVPGEVLLEVRGLTSPLPQSFKDISFQLRKGEILGIGGLVGAQRTELIEALFGLRGIAAGSVKIRGKEVKIKTPEDAIGQGMALLTEERRATGIFPVLPVHENASIANLGRYRKLLFFLDGRMKKKEADRMVEKLRTKTPTTNTLIMNLSGGNQQKVLLARWLLTDPDILLLDEPTRGIDIGAKFEIYAIINDLAKQGKSIIMISSEMPELIGMSDKIMVMSEGRLTGMLDGKNASEEEIMRLAAQH